MRAEIIVANLFVGQNTRSVKLLFNRLEIKINRNKYFSILSEMLEDNVVVLNDNLIVSADRSHHEKQQHTNQAFSEKWEKYEKSEEKNGFSEFQRSWYLKLYGFETEERLKAYLSHKYVILDAGCGYGYKAAWFAKLAPHALVIAMDFSESVRQAAQSYCDLENLFFIQGDISKTGLLKSCVDYTSCDQVIMHTEDPEATFTELARITSSNGGEVACYFYAKKALPRELLDDYFRTQCMKMDSHDIWAMSEQLTELGIKLSDLNISFECPDIPALGIKGGHYDIQRFIYWNFLKCFWNESLGLETSIMTNFDWYSPSNARRFSKDEVEKIVSNNKLLVTYFHSEEACYSGRFRHET